MTKWTHVNPGNLKIARKNTGLTTREATDKVCGKNRKDDKVLEWEEGIDLPTFKQLDKLSKLYEVSWLLLAGKRPIPENRQIPSFRRTAVNERNANCGRFINFLLERQDYLEAALKGEGVLKNPVPGSIEYPGDNDVVISTKIVRIIAEDITRAIRYKSYIIRQSPAEHLKYFISLVESQGVFVMKTLSYWPIPKEFMQGLYLHNEHAPIIALNRADDKQSQLFTLANEVVHMFIKREGIGDIGFITHSSDTAERFCNEVAANLLLPRYRFTQPSYDYDDINKISRLHQLNPLLVFYRLKGLGLIEIGQISNIKKRIEAEPPLGNKYSGTRGGYNSTMKDSNGHLFNDVISSLYFDQKIGAVETMNVLRLSIESISD